jgi:hypothetical protein
MAGVPVPVPRSSRSSVNVPGPPDVPAPLPVACPGPLRPAWVRRGRRWVALGRHGHQADPSPAPEPHRWRQRDHSHRPYLEWCWLPVVGPSTVALVRRVAGLTANSGEAHIRWAS